MSKSITLQFEDDLISQSESLLDDIGLDCQTFVKMCFKKLNKEKSISFLTAANIPVIASDENKQIPFCLPKSEETSAEYSFKRTKNEITAQMRDYIWEMFKSQYCSNKKVDCLYSAKIASAEIGITQGSAYIYFLILDNLVAGVPNKRTMKFNDLVIYLRYIKEQLPETCIANSLKSLSQSVPYWEKHIPGYFAQKVSDLIAQYGTV